MKKIVGAWLAGTLVLLGLAVAAPAGVIAAKKTPTPAAGAGAGSLDARLGGSRASFEAKYGKPVKGKGGANIAAYDVKGYGLVAAAFTNGNAAEVTLAADRLTHKPLTDPDNNDWTVATATTDAQDFIPADATFAKPDRGQDKITVTGHSKLLEPVFDRRALADLAVGGKPGDLLVVFNLDTKGNVFSVDLSLGTGAAPTSTARPSGARPTAAAAGTRTAGAPSGSGNVKHCRDFKTHDEAQAYFAAHGGDSNPDVNGMDGDRDGRACETLP